jgi:hypothetical protein
MNISQVAYVRKNKPSKTLRDKRWVKKALSHKCEERKCKDSYFLSVSIRLVRVGECKGVSEWD